MIVFLHTAEHSYTHRKVPGQARDVQVRSTNYRLAFSCRELPAVTYVFTDLDRLSLTELGLAAELYRCLRAGGARVLNDPARVPSRYGLLRSLHEAGVNTFDAYRVEERVVPERWPVFLRCEGGHEPPVSGLLNDWTEVCRAVDQAVATGYPLQSLLLVEYAAEPVRPGLYRKLAAYQVGDASFAACSVVEDHWVVKYGKLGIAPPEMFEEELAFVRDYPCREWVQRVFATANIEYGRADFGMARGRPELYEINLNPMIEFPVEHHNPVRRKTFEIVNANYLASLSGIDSASDAPPIPLATPGLERYRRRVASTAPPTYTVQFDTARSR